MPLIAEVVLAVSVGCVEIRTSSANHERDEMDSYQVEQLNSVFLYFDVLDEGAITN